MRFSMTTEGIRDKFLELAEDWYIATLGGYDALASGILDEITELIEEARP